MKLWNQFINCVWAVEEPISMTMSNKVLLAVAMLSILLLALLTGFQSMQNVF